MARCFWCKKIVSDKKITRDHLIPLGMGGKDGKDKVVPACRVCNEERGKVTEFYCHRNQLVKNIHRRPDRITSYKNRFRKKVRKMFRIILKWETLHRQKGVILPFNLLEIVRLDEMTPL